MWVTSDCHKNVSWFSLSHKFYLFHDSVRKCLVTVESESKILVNYVTFLTSSPGFSTMILKTRVSKRGKITIAMTRLILDVEPRWKIPLYVVYCEMMYKNHAWRGQTTAVKETVPSLTIAHGVDVSWCLSLIRDNWFCLYYKTIKLEEESLTLRKFLWKFCLRFNRSSFNVIREVLTAPWSAWLQLNLTKLLIFRFLR